MASTTVISIPASWTEIGDLANTNLIQLKSGGAIEIQVSDSAPTTGQGFTMSNEGIRELVFYPAETGGKIYAKAVLHAPVSIVVLEVTGA